MASNMANQTQTQASQRAGEHGRTHDRLMLASLAILIVTASLLVTEQPTRDIPAEQNLEAIVQAAIHEPVDDELPLVENIIADLPVSTGELPDFAAITNVQEKKQAFFSFLLPKVRAANNNIREERRYLLKLRDMIRSNHKISDEQLQTLASMAKRYRVGTIANEQDLINSLLLRVDVVPESLVLAQAANESGWGTSRFARKANNLFGVWCFRVGCGLEPLQREEGLTHEVARYPSIQTGIQAYMHTLNTNAAYIELRHIRADYRADADYLSGLAMAEGLLKYSARGADYVREIQAMIRVNKLQRFNQPA